MKAKLLGEGEVYGINLAAVIKQGPYLFLVFLESNRVIDTKYPFEYNIFTTISYQYSSCQDQH